VNTRKNLFRCKFAHPIDFDMVNKLYIGLMYNQPKNNSRKIRMSPAINGTEGAKQSQGSNTDTKS